MAKDFNQAIVMGNLTRDPEMRTTPSGQNVTSFSVATNRSWQDQSGERKDAVEYHNVVAWGKLGELVNNGQAEAGDFSNDEMNQEAPTKNTKKEDTSMDDLGDGDINLDDIPF